MNPASLPLSLHYHLTRRQRLIPHLRLWGFVQLVVIAGLILPFATGTVAHSWWCLLPPALLALVARGYLIGLLNVLLVKSQPMDIRIEERSLGYREGKERRYLFLDGLTAVRDLERSVWTILHWNGTVIQIPKDLLTDEGLQFLQDWVRQANQIRTELGIASPYPTESAEV